MVTVTVELSQQLLNGDQIHPGPRQPGGKRVPEGLPDDAWTTPWSIVAERLLFEPVSQNEILSYRRVRAHGRHLNLGTSVCAPSCSLAPLVMASRQSATMRDGSASMD